MKRNYLFMAAIAILGLTACSTQNVATYSYEEVRTLEPKSSVVTLPLIANIEVRPERINYAEQVIVQTKNKKISTEELLTIKEKQKDLVLHNAIQAYKADLLVAPNISIKMHDNILDISVSGYPANYTTFRQATHEDLWITGFPTNNDDPTPNSITNQKNPSGLFHLFY